MTQQIMTEGDTHPDMGYGGMAAYNNYYGGYEAYNEYQQQQYSPEAYEYNYDQNEANLTYAALEAPAPMHSQNLDIPASYEEEEENLDDAVIRAAQAVDPAPVRPQPVLSSPSSMSYYDPGPSSPPPRKVLGVLQRKPKVKKGDKIDGRKKKCPRLHQCIQVGLLSGLAFMNSGKDVCSLREIYAFIVENFEGFDIRVEAWKKSIRHSLCTHSQIYTKASGDGNWMFRNKQLYQEKLYAYLQKNSDVTTYGLKDPSLWGQIVAGTRGIPLVYSREEQKANSELRKRRVAESNAHRMATKRRRQYSGYGGEVQMMPMEHEEQETDEHSMEVWQNMMMKYQAQYYLPQYNYHYYANGYPVQMAANYQEEYLKQQQVQQEDPALVAYYNYYNNGGIIQQGEEQPQQDYLVPNSAESQYLAESPDFIAQEEPVAIEYQEPQQL